MEFFTLLKVLWFLGTALFDVVSDLINALCFYYPSIIQHQLFNRTQNNFTTVQTAECNTPNCTNDNAVTTYNQTEIHLLWGSMGIGVIFSPGIFALIFAILVNE